MNYKVKRVLLGASTILIAGVAYAKSDAVPMPTKPQTTSNTSTHSTEKTLNNDVQALNQQVVSLQKKVQQEALRTKTQTSHLHSLTAEEKTMESHAIAVAQAKALAAERRAMAQAQARSNPPTVQTVTRASGGGDDGHHDHGDDGHGDDGHGDDGGGDD